MNHVSPGTIALLAFQVSVLLGLSLGVAALLLPLANSVAILALAFTMLAGYALLVGYVGLSSIYLFLHWREMPRRQAAWACVAVGLFALLWGSVFESGPNAIVHETGAILSTFETRKGLLTRLCIVNEVRETYKRALHHKIDRDICKNEADFLQHLAVVRDEDVPSAKLVRQLEARYRSVSCF
ncbi:MAG: hypothetical protein HDQ89_02725 [Desulfovibrio sp.]|nr:hypothetical protein [Desulfovibrio sp.]